MRFTLNGKSVDVRAHPMKRLLDVLREDCGLTGTKEGCGEGECGACTVLLDGEAVNSCLLPFGQVRGAAVVTVEGLGGRHPLQHAFVREGGSQCGICTPGMIMAASALPGHVTKEDVRAGLAGNLCRCTGYSGIYRAIEVGQRPQATGHRARAAAGGRAARRQGNPSGGRTERRRTGTGRRRAGD